MPAVNLYAIAENEEPMKEFRNWLAATLVWLFFLYNIERLSAPINLASFVYVYVMVCAVAILYFRSLQRLQLYWLFLLALPPYFILKMLVGHKLLGTRLPLTVTEISAIWLTIFLSWHLAKRIGEFSEAISKLVIGHEHKDAPPFNLGQSRIYREIRRARQHEEPGSLLAVSVSENSVKEDFDRVIQKMQKELVQRYVNARLSRLLLEKLQYTDIVTRRNNHFVIYLPETGREGGSKVIHRIRALAQKDLGLSLNIGLSTFPDEATTFDGLLNNAEKRMKIPEVLLTNEPLTENQANGQTR